MPDHAWAYHATESGRLPLIRQQGLLPQTKPRSHGDESRGTEDAVVFFSIAPRYADIWGQVTIRFPWPDNAEQDPYGDSIKLPTGEIDYTNWYTHTAIAPASIEVRRGSRWISLESIVAAARRE